MQQDQLKKVVSFFLIHDRNRMVVETVKEMENCELGWLKNEGEIQAKDNEYNGFEHFELLRRFLLKIVPLH